LESFSTSAVAEGPCSPVTPLADREFARFRALIFRLAGIHISEAKKALVCGRLGRRLRHHKLSNYAEYLELVERDLAERQVMVDLLTTNETYFFREPRHFELLRDELLAPFQQERELRIWSAAASTGEEPYSLAMILAELRGQREWQLLGTDISTRVLETARAGIYPITATERIPKPYLLRYCLKGVRSQVGSFAITTELKKRITFQQLNLNGEWPDLGQFHLIFLRNVMIYFNRDTKLRLVERLAQRLHPGGHLVVGHSETLSGLSDRFQLVVPSVYQRK